MGLRIARFNTPSQCCTWPGPRPGCRTPHSAGGAPFPGRSIPQVGPGLPRTGSAAQQFCSTKHATRGAASSLVGATTRGEHACKSDVNLSLSVSNACARYIPPPPPAPLRAPAHRPPLSAGRSPRLGKRSTSTLRSHNARVSPPPRTHRNCAQMERVAVCCRTVDASLPGRARRPTAAFRSQVSPLPSLVSFPCGVRVVRAPVCDAENMFRTEPEKSALKNPTWRTRSQSPTSPALCRRVSVPAGP
eukprot:3935478-Rhodomonas_salina.5